jgi:hypothetical protein
MDKVCNRSLFWVLTSEDAGSVGLALSGALYEAENWPEWAVDVGLHVSWNGTFFMLVLLSLVIGDALVLFNTNWSCRIRALYLCYNLKHLLFVNPVYRCTLFLWPLLVLSIDVHAKCTKNFATGIPWGHVWVVTFICVIISYQYLGTRKLQPPWNSYLLPVLPYALSSFMLEVLANLM